MTTIIAELITSGVPIFNISAALGIVAAALVELKGARSRRWPAWALIDEEDRHSATSRSARSRYS